MLNREREIVPWLAIKVHFLGSIFRFQFPIFYIP